MRLFFDRVEIEIPIPRSLLLWDGLLRGIKTYVFLTLDPRTWIWGQSGIPKDPIASRCYINNKPAYICKQYYYGPVYVSRYRNYVDAQEKV